VSTAENWPVTPIVARTGAVGTQQRERRSRADLQVDAVKDDLPPNDLRSPAAMIALVMLLLSSSPRPGGRNHVENARSGIHRGFTAVSFAGPGAQRPVARIVAHARCLIPGLRQADATGRATRRLAGSGGVRLEAFGPVRVTAAVEDDAERVAILHPRRTHRRADPRQGAALE
jgi:hypothetical protein